MKLLEYEAKQLIAAAGIVVPNSWIVSSNTYTELKLPAVFKSQVPTGGRGKAGGIIVVHNDVDIESTIAKIYDLPIKGHKPQTILVEELINISREFYISVSINRSKGIIELVTNVNGGVEVESNNIDSFLRIPINSNTLKNMGQTLATYFDLPLLIIDLQNIATKLFECMASNDAILIELNPLILTSNNELVAGDCKMELDNAAAYRHPNWSFEERIVSNNYVTLDPNGNVATIANGAGLAMATVDAVADSGMQPANFLDVGGGANSESVLAAFNKIVEFNNVRTIIINIFAGITRCDEVAKAIIAARDQINNLPPLFIRLSGTNVDIAKKLLSENNIQLLPTLEACILAAKKEVTNG